MTKLSTDEVPAGDSNPPKTPTDEYPVGDTNPPKPPTVDDPSSNTNPPKPPIEEDPAGKSNPSKSPINEDPANGHPENIENLVDESIIGIKIIGGMKRNDAKAPNINNDESQSESMTEIK